MSNKVLFLDVDSVLNSHKEWIIAGEAVSEGKYDEVKHIVHVYDKVLQCPISRVIGVEKLKRLKEIVEITGCEIVGISSWFTDMEDIAEFNADTGLKLIDIGYTTTGGSHRYDEVLRYLQDHSEYEYAVILDDIPYMNCGLDNIHVCPTDVDGLNEENKQKCIKILSKKWKTLCKNQIK